MKNLPESERKRTESIYVGKAKDSAQAIAEVRKDLPDGATIIEVKKALYRGGYYVTIHNPKNYAP